MGSLSNLEFFDIALIVTLIFIFLMVGISGYYYLARLSAIDSFLNACMILSGMGPVGEITETNGKIFSGFYALFSGLFFIAIISYILTKVL